MNYCKASLEAGTFIGLEKVFLCHLRRQIAVSSMQLADLSEPEGRMSLRV